MEVGDDGVEMLVDSKDMQQQSKALDKLTDRVELFLVCLSEVVVVVFAYFRERELAAVKINAAEVDIIASEVELDKKIVERTLRC